MLRRIPLLLCLACVMTGCSGLLLAPTPTAAPPTATPATPAPVSTTFAL